MTKMNLLFRESGDRTVTGNWVYWGFVFLLFILAFLCFRLIPGFPSELFFECKFPITNRCHYSSPLPASRFRTPFSIIIYTLLIGVFATLPLYRYKYFEKKQFYLLYKIFWLIAAILCARCSYLLYYGFGSTTKANYYQFWFFHLSIVNTILILTQIPATLQYHKTKNNHAAIFIYLLITWFYVFLSAYDVLSYLFPLGGMH